MRSESVRDYLTAQGMSSEQLATVEHALVASAPAAPRPRNQGPVAQLEAQLHCKEKDAGSNPAR